MWAVQFHPEVHHTPLGTEHSAQLRLEYLRRKADLDGAALHRRHRRQVRKTVGNGRAICALSGGVDSAVAAVLVDRAMRDGRINHG